MGWWKTTNSFFFNGGNDFRVCISIFIDTISIFATGRFQWHFREKKIGVSKSTPCVTFLGWVLCDPKSRVAGDFQLYRGSSWVTAANKNSLHSPWQSMVLRWLSFWDLWPLFRDEVLNFTLDSSPQLRQFHSFCHHQVVWQSGAGDFSLDWWRGRCCFSLKEGIDWSKNSGPKKDRYNCCKL